MLVNSFPEQTNPERKLVTVKYYLTREEAAQFNEIAFQVYIQKGIPRNTLGAFAKAAGYKWYNEVNQALARDKAIPKKDTTSR
jgi:hypothetical protein